MKGFLDTRTLPVYAFSSYRCFVPGERHVTRHCPENVLLVVFSGVLRFVEAGEPVEVRAGEYYIQRRGLYQQGVEPSDVPSYYYVHFHGDWCDDAGIAVRGVFAPETPTLIAQLDAHRLHNAPLLALSAGFYQLLLLLRSEQPIAPGRRLAETIRQRLQRAQADDASLLALSKELHFSENYLIRIFRDAYGQTPHAYLISLRLERAAQLMRYSDLSLERIALECGFGGYANFFKAYKKAYGTSPRTGRAR